MAAVSQSEPSGLQNVSTLLESIAACLSSTGSSLPKAEAQEPSDVSIEPPQDGISLLDTKSDLLLAYLHNLIFLILFQLRKLSSNTESEGDDEGGSADALQEEIVKKLVELRVYMERGVRPLEGRLKYQVDKVVKAAEDAERTERGAAAAKGNSTNKPADSGSEEQSASDKEASGSEDDSEDSEDKNEGDIDEMAYRPNVSAFSKGVERQAKPNKPTTEAPSDGVYRPPKIMPTALPTTESRAREERRPRKSHVIDEFVNAEMSSAPMAEPSIGSMITKGGRQTKSKKDKELEAERAAYEETNFMRLPKEGKKERAKRRDGRPESTFGGEEWRGLTEGADRIEKLTKRAKGSGNALENSRKRKPTEDGPRSDGAGVGQIFEKRRKKVENYGKR